MGGSQSKTGVPEDGKDDEPENGGHVHSGVSNEDGGEDLDDPKHMSQPSSDTPGEHAVVC